MTERDRKQTYSINLCTPELSVADPHFNSLQIQKMINSIPGGNADFPLIVFPQLSLSSVSCADIFSLPLLPQACLEELEKIEKSLTQRECLVLVGLPLLLNGEVFDAVAVLNGVGLLGFVLNPHSAYLPTQTAGTPGVCRYPWKEGSVPIFKNGDLPPLVEGQQISVCIGDVPEHIALNQNEILLNPCALPALGDEDYNTKFYEISKNQPGILAICSAGASESTANVVYSGLRQVWQAGKLLADGKQLSFQNELTSFRPGYAQQSPLIQNFYYAQPEREPANPFLFINNTDAQLERVFQIQVCGLIGRLRHTRLKKMVLGLSGGADSSMALMVCIEAARQLDLTPADILAISMPGPGSSTSSLQRIDQLIQLSAVSKHLNQITTPVFKHLEDIGHDGKPDITFENVQARFRTLYLMNYANLVGGLVVGTGDLSEIALGWSTYSGDQMSMYNVNAGLPKTVLLRLLPQVSQALFGEAGLLAAQKVVEAPISPELQPVNSEGQTEQETEDVLGPYRLHDFFLFHAIGERRNPDTVFKLARKSFGKKYSAKFILGCLRRFYQRFFQHQFKRSASPDGPQLFKLGLDASTTWRMPSDASSALWLDALDQLENQLNQEDR